MCKNLILVWVSVELWGLYHYTEANNLGPIHRAHFLIHLYNITPKKIDGMQDLFAWPP